MGRHGDVFGAQGTGTTGTARGKIRFQGKAGNVLSLTGKGEGNIENARLVELPLFLGILSRLFGESSGRHYFNEVALRYTIGDGKFKAGGDGVEIRSQGLKLIGGGTMDFSGALDLALEPRFGRSLIKLAHIYKQQGRPDDVHATLQSLAALDPEQARELSNELETP